MEPEDLYAFLSDPNLTEMVETNKTTDDVFDVFRLYENQHSELLAWCMNPNEGHGQGDAVIKDFLEAAYHASANVIWDNKKFFEKWTPGQIRTSSFGAAFVTREFELHIESEGKKGRLDLFLVDPQNKLLITIENKAGASLTAKQLEKYVEAVKDNIASNKTFLGYQLAFIVLDRELASCSDEKLSTLGKRWTLLDYTWLSASAKRARFQLERDSRSAQLLVAYCQRQTDWESPAEKRMSDLAVELAMTHPSVVDAMRELKKQSMKDWKPLTGHYGELRIFLSQNHSVCEKIVSTQGVAMLTKQLLKTVPTLTLEQIDTGRTWLAVTPPSVSKELMQQDEDATWPIYINLSRDAKLSRPNAPRYNLQLVWARTSFDTTRQDEALLRSHFTQVFPGLKTFATSDTRKLLISENMSHNTAIEQANKLLEKVNSTLLAYLKT